MSLSISNIQDNSSQNILVKQMHCNILNMLTNMTVLHIQLTYYKYGLAKYSSGLRHWALTGLSDQAQTDILAVHIYNM
jgi:hypothetical protein